MTLDGRQVAEMQYFLMDAAKRYVASGAGRAAAGEVLASAAALDYVLLISSEHAAELLDDEAAPADSVRQTVGRAASAALDVVAVMLTAPDDVFEDFVERHIRRACIFELVSGLLRDEVIRSGDVAFRNLTLASEVLERRCAG